MLRVDDAAFWLPWLLKRRLSVTPHVTLNFEKQKRNARRQGPNSLKSMQSVRLLRSAVHLSSLLQRPLFVNSQRSFSCTAQRWNEEKQEVGGEEAAAAVEEEAEQQAEPVKLSRRRRRFHEWVQGSGAKFIRPADGTTNYLGTTVMGATIASCFHLHD